jgi:hypothetical protein
MMNRKALSGLNDFARPTNRSFEGAAQVPH